MTGRRVKIISKSTAVAAKAVKPGKVYPLSVLDHAMARHTLRLVFYYPASPAVDRDKLMESLSDVLTYFPAVTGRLTRGAEDGNWVVKCNDAGVRVLDAEVDASLDDWLRSASESEQLELTYCEDMGDDPFIWSPFYIQISGFNDGGIAIGLTCPHMYADPTCAILLVKAWGDAHRLDCIVNPPFFHPPGLRRRTNPNTSTPSTALLASKSATPSPPPTRMSTATFLFPANSVHLCLDRIRPDSPSATPFDALTSLFWWRLRSPHPLTVCLDFRKRMHAPLPHGFFGNALHFSTVPSGDGAASSASSWGQLAEKVRAHAAGLEEEEYWSTVDWFEERRSDRGGKGRYAEAFAMYGGGPGLTCVMMDHVFCYAAVFEGGKAPMHVMCRIEGGVGGEGLVLVMPHPDGGDGRTVTVTVPEDRIDEIRKDEVIVGLGATLLFGDGR